VGVYGCAGLNKRVWPRVREFISLANVPLCHYNTLLSWPVSRSIQSLPIATQHMWFMQASWRGKNYNPSATRSWIDYAYSVEWREAINLNDYSSVWKRLSHLSTQKNNHLHSVKHGYGTLTTTGAGTRKDMCKRLLCISEIAVTVFSHVLIPLISFACFLLPSPSHVFTQHRLSICIL